MSDEERFWSMVDKSGECWLWTGSRHLNGYGRFGLKRTRVATHRYSYSLAHGPIADGMDVLHRCDVPSCVRPDHLRLGTARDNAGDAMARDRLARGESHGLAKLTSADIPTIRGAAKAGQSQRSLATAYGVSPRTINKVINGRTWRHVP